MARPIPTGEREASSRRDVLEPDLPVPAKHSTAKSEKQRVPKRDEELAVEKSSEDSYPASDAPAW